MLGFLPSDALLRVSDFLWIGEVLSLRLTSAAVCSTIDHCDEFRRDALLKELTTSRIIPKKSSARTQLMNLYDPRRWRVTSHKSPNGCMRRWLHRSSGGFVFGGRSGDCLLNDLWRVRADMSFELIKSESGPSARCSAGFAVWDKKFILFGGLAQEGLEARFSNEVWFAEMDESVEWRRLRRGPEARWGHVMVGIGGSANIPPDIYLFGGSSPGKLHDDFYSFKSGKFTACDVSALPPPRAGHAACECFIDGLGLCLVISGGNTPPPNVETRTDMWVYSPELNGIWIPVLIDVDDSESFQSAQSDDNMIETVLAPRIGHSIISIRKNVVVIAAGRDIANGQHIYYDYMEIVKFNEVKLISEQYTLVASVSKLVVYNQLCRTGACTVPVTGGFLLLGGLGASNHKHLQEEGIEGLPPIKEGEAELPDDLVFIEIL